MILRELFYFDKDTMDATDDTRYEPEHDESPVNFDDTRKVRLTLKQINRIRKASELSVEERKKDLHFVRQMYGIAANAETGM